MKIFRVGAYVGWTLKVLRQWFNALCVGLITLYSFPFPFLFFFIICKHVNVN